MNPWDDLDDLDLPAGTVVIIDGIITVIRK